MSLAGRMAFRATRALRSVAARLSRKPARTVEIEGVAITFTNFQGDTANQILGHHETEVYDYISSLPRDAVFFDLGSSIGNFALFAGLKGLTTVAFEPDRASFKTLVANIKANGLGNVTPCHMAISDGRQAEATLMTNSDKVRPGDHHKVLSLDKNAAHPGILVHLNKKQTVTAMSIDQAIEKRNLPFPDYMKIDIDGSELVFLQGGARTLSNPKLKGFIIELYKPSELHEAIMGLITGYGFELKEEFQIYSGIPAVPEDGLFNMVFERRAA